MSLTRQRLLVFLFPLLLSLPFLNRAYFVDDHYFVEIATWLKSNPTLPYHFRADDAGLQNRGWEENGFVRMVNPLAHHYFLALLMKLGGTQIWFLRLGCVMLACFSGIFIFELARRWTSYPLLSTFLALATPAHWLTAHSLLIDGTLGFFFFGAVYFFIRGGELDSIFRLVLSGIFMGLVILTKYPGILVIPVTLAWLIFRRGKVLRWWIYAIPWIIGISFLLFYSSYTAHLYGAAHILAASGRMVQVYGWTKYLVFFVFFSGSLIVPVVAWQVIGMKNSIWAGLVVFLMALIFSSKLGGFSFIQAGLIGLWTVTSILFLFSLWMFKSSWIFPRDHFLITWVLGFIFMMHVVMGWVAARYYVIVIPPVVFLCVRMMEISLREKAERFLSLTLVGLMGLSASLAYADYKQAEPSRLIGSELIRNGFQGGPRHFYLGDSFTMSYLKEEGWVPCFENTDFQVGDLVLTKEVTMPQVWFFRKDLELKQIDQWDYPTRFPLKVMDNKGSAGFYASVWGALPFTISSSPWEKFHLLEVVGFNSIPDDPKKI